MKVLVGVDIGGTKCAVSIGKYTNDELTIVERQSFPTPGTPDEAITEFINMIEKLTNKNSFHSIDAIGISCGGPLDSDNGLILSPPNLQNWDHIDLYTPLKEKFHTCVALENDANACALAEWQWGAGKGTSNMIFLTFGTGMGAGLILNGQLYRGTNNMAGEVGHVRLEENGPIGYGKKGSFEGFCSGGGIARLGKIKLEQAIHEGRSTILGNEIETITAKDIGLGAEQGDPLSLEIYQLVGEKLGMGLAILVDILNPERIVIGSIYRRQQSILEPIVMSVLEREALSQSLGVCEIVSSGLGESVGDYASFSVAINALESQSKLH